MRSFKVIIAGGREFSQKDLLHRFCDKVLQNKQEVEVVSGGAKGADYLGECYAKEKGFKLSVFPAKWAEYGKAAGAIRNLEMAKYADALIAFWDGRSKGTKDMIDKATRKGLKVRICKY